MRIEIENPAARAGAYRAQLIRTTTKATDGRKSIEETVAPQQINFARFTQRLRDARQTTVGPTPLDQSALDWLLNQGVSSDIIGTFSIRESDPMSVRSATVLLDGRGHYSYNAIGEFAYILPVVARSTIIDHVAWVPSTGQLASHDGNGAMLGEGQLGRDGLGTTGRAIRVHRTPLGWLRAGRQGLVIVNACEAAHRLSGVTLRAEDEAHLEELADLLRLPSPTILTSEVTGGAA
jgi:hypothetical protein